MPKRLGIRDSHAAKSPLNSLGKSGARTGVKGEGRDCLLSKTCQSGVHACSRHPQCPSAKRPLKSTLLLTMEGHASQKSVLLVRDPSPPCSQVSPRQVDTGPVPHLDLASSALGEDPDLQRPPPRTPRTSAWGKIQCQDSMGQESGPRTPKSSPPLCSTPK